MAREIEIKFRLENLEATTRRLAAAGAKKTFQGLEHNVVFDDGTLHDKGMLLRLRNTGLGMSVLTFKTPIENKEFKEKEEIEVAVSDFETMKKILLGLGYKIFWVYEKQRTDFSFERAKISVDRLPFADFMEIEGNEADIRKAIAKLGLDPKKGIKDSYYKIYEDHCRQVGKKMGNMVFNEGKRSR
jgi:adenylate cyclase class 2